jgi:hypothetical protein
MWYPFALYALMPLLILAGFRVGRWFGTTYDTHVGHYIVAFLMVCGAIAIVVRATPSLDLWSLSLFAGFYAGLFIGGHDRLWKEEQRKTGRTDRTAA